MCSARGRMDGKDWVWALPILWEQGVLDACLCCDGVGGEGAWTRVWRGGVMSGLSVCGCRTWICLDITRLYDE